MHVRTGEFLQLDKQLFARDIASTLVELLRQKNLTAKQAARRYDLDPATIANLQKGICSLGTLLKIALVEGRALWEQLGDEVFGETLDAYEERRLQQIIDEANDAQERLVRLRARREALDARAVDAVSALDRDGPHRDRVRNG